MSRELSADAGSRPANAARSWLRRAGLLARVGRRALQQPHAFFAELDGYLRRRGEAPGGAGSLRPPGELPSIAPLNVRLDPSLPPRLNVLLPGLSLRAMSGGPNTAANLTYRMAAAGVPVRYVSTDVPKDPDDAPLLAHFAALAQVQERPAHVELACGADRGRQLVLGERDVFFATAWWTAQMAARIVPRAPQRRFFYLVQEFEPGLYPLSTEYALALETYGMEIEPIVCSQLLLEHLIEQRIGHFDRGALVFEPALDRSRFFVEPRSPGRKRRLLFYGRPNAPRNLWDLGLAVLARAVREGLLTADGWEIWSMGEPVPDVDLGSGVVMRGQPWLDYDQYAALLRSADIGLSLMLSPHPSYPPLEMAAAGVPCVTTSFGPKTPERLAAICGNVVAAAPALDPLVGALREAMARSPAASREAAARVAWPSSWSQAFDAVLPELLRRFARLTA